jgi:hypothetical protein
MSLAFFLYGARTTITSGLVKAACHSKAKFGSWEINSKSGHFLNLDHHDRNNWWGLFKSSLLLACFKVKFNLFVGA